MCQNPNSAYFAGPLALSTMSVFGGDDDALHRLPEKRFPHFFRG